MTLERVFTCPRTLDQLRGGPLGGLMDGFCSDLLDDGFAPGTVRRHLSNVKETWGSSLYLYYLNHQKSSPCTQKPGQSAIGGGRKYSANPLTLGQRVSRLAVP
jgi:hypothetical protein